MYRAVDRLGNTRAAKRFPGKALGRMKEWVLPKVLNTDKAPTYAGAIVELKAEDKCPKDTRRWRLNYLNNVAEADQGKIKPNRALRNFTMASSARPGSSSAPSVSVRTL